MLAGACSRNRKYRIFASRLGHEVGAQIWLSFIV
jgi:hypothetical protein